MNELTLEGCEKFWNSLFEAAMRQCPVNTIYTILRVTAYEPPNWDPLEESDRAFADLSRLFDRTKPEGSEDCLLRLALLMYCHAVEISAVHELLANLLRVVSGRPYVMRPFEGLVRKKKARPLHPGTPPSAKMKFGEIKQLAEQAGRDDVADVIDCSFNDGVRNAFSHSDYILTNEELRWAGGTEPHRVLRSDLLTLIQNCFWFVGAFFRAYPRWRYSLGRLKRYHQWPRYEVFELLASDEIGLFGFRVHFSNGSSARFVRKHLEGSEPLNIWPTQEGTVDFFVGDRDALEPVWKIDGNPVHSWDLLDNPPACRPT